MAKVETAKASGVWEDLEKSNEENDTPPEETSGTPEMVVLEVEQVTLFMMLSTESWVSAGRATLPITKQAFAWREERAGAERAVVRRARWVRRVRECILVVFLAGRRSEALLERKYD